MWQLPQNMLAKLVYAFYKGKLKKTTTYKGFAWWVITATVYYIEGFPGGLSLGQFIFVYPNCGTKMIKHEYGHCLQSKMLGWLYLIVVFIPSFVMACLTRLGILEREGYYKRYPEAWADTLGGVIR